VTKSILVVCMGNICRSPLAEGILHKKLDAAGLDISVDSAGTGSWHVGDAPDARAVVAARLKGYDITGIRARALQRDDFATFDLILAMDQENIRDLENLRPAGNATPVRLITEFGADDRPQEVTDPYYTGKFNHVIETLEASIEGLIDQLRARQ